MRLLAPSCTCVTQLCTQNLAETTRIDAVSSTLDLYIPYNMQLSVQDVNIIMPIPVFHVFVKRTTKDYVEVYHT